MPVPPSTTTCPSAMDRTWAQRSHAEDRRARFPLSRIQPGQQWVASAGKDNRHLPAKICISFQLGFWLSIRRPMTSAMAHYRSRTISAEQPECHTAAATGLTRRHSWPPGEAAAISSAEFPTKHAHQRVFGRAGQADGNQIVLDVDLVASMQRLAGLGKTERRASNQRYPSVIHLEFAGTESPRPGVSCRTRRFRRSAHLQVASPVSWPIPAHPPESRMPHDAR